MSNEISKRNAVENAVRARQAKQEGRKPTDILRYEEAAARGVPLVTAYTLNQQAKELGQAEDPEVFSR